MKRFLFLALLAGCSSSGRRFEGEAVPPVLLPIPPEHVMRRHPDFRFTDHSTGREYCLRFYSDENVREEIVTVRDPGRSERSATPDERRYAFSVFEEDWKSKGDADRLRYSIERYENEKKRDARLYDLKIHNEEVALQGFWEQYEITLANLRARKDTNVHPKEGDELSTKFHEPPDDFLERELVRWKAEIQAAESRLKMLRYQRSVADAEFSRSSAAQFRRDSVPVADLLRHVPADRLIARIKQDVEPETWNRTQTRIDVQGDSLSVTQLPRVIDRIRNYLDNLRIEFRREPDR